MSVYDELPSPSAGILRYARLKAGLSQLQVAERAGIPRSMVSAYERDQRQPTLPTLMNLLKAAGFELRMQLAPVDDHDEVLREIDRYRSSEDRVAWERYQSSRVKEDSALAATARRVRRKPTLTV